MTSASHSGRFPPFPMSVNVRSQRRREKEPSGLSWVTQVGGLLRWLRWWAPLNSYVVTLFHVAVIVNVATSAGFIISWANDSQIFFHGLLKNFLETLKGGSLFVPFLKFYLLKYYILKCLNTKGKKV